MHRKKIKILILSLLLVSLIFVAHSNVFAAAEIGLNYLDETGLEKADDVNFQQLMISIIKYLMTFLGIISVSVILYGGFIWMTAGGNDENVAKAKKIIIAGLSGLIIILSSYAIVNFVSTTTDDILQDGSYDGAP